MAEKSDLDFIELLNLFIEDLENNKNSDDLSSRLIESGFSYSLVNKARQQASELYAKNCWGY